jgi:hypothetical protein
MCSRTCYCEKAAYDEKYNTYTAAEFAEGGRQKTSMKTLAKGYKNWMECYDKVISKANKTSSCTETKDIEQGCEVPQNEEYKQFIKNGGVQFLADFEKKFKCAGFCKTPLFYMTRNITEGKPERDCLTAMATEYGSNTGVGAVGVITGLTLLLAAFGAIPLCKDYNKLEE